jgi:hypothetical protein
VKQSTIAGETIMWEGVKINNYWKSITSLKTAGINGLMEKVRRLRVEAGGARAPPPLPNSIPFFCCWILNA